MPAATRSVPARPTPAMRFGAPLLVAAFLVAAAPASAGAAADPKPPELPNSGTCVPASEVTLSAPAWAFRQLAPMSVWPVTTGAGTTVAIVDSGVSKAAPSLRGAVRPGRSLAGGGAATRDCRGSGTALASIVAARQTSGSGLVGVAPDSTVVGLRVVADDGDVSNQTLAAGIEAALSQYADVILVGASTAVDDQRLRKAVAEAERRGVLVVAGVAPKTDDGSPTWYPAAYPTVLAVNAAGQGGVVGATGQRVDLAAPGTDAVGAAPTGSGHYAVGGTPVAAAHVAGTAALLRSYQPGMSAADLRRTLIAGARPLDGPPSRRSAAGAGIVDVYAAVVGIRPATTAATAQPGPAAAVAMPEPRDASRPRRAAGAAAAAALVTVVGTAALLLIARRSRAEHTTPH